MRTQDMGIVDQQYHCRSHLGHLLKAGDTVLGFDVATSNVNNKHLETVSKFIYFQLKYFMVSIFCFERNLVTPIIHNKARSI